MTRRLLMLERSQWTLSEEEIVREVYRQSERFPLLSKIDEIWFAETVFYDTSKDPGWRDALGVVRYDAAGNELEDFRV
ncbi:MAG: hypothetical protein ABL986_24400, partial [Vicinamibacterales bacterium]